MQSKIQELTDKLYNEGIEKANEEAGKIVKDAKTKAEEIKKIAEQEAEEIIAKAKKESEDLKKNSKAELDLAYKQSIRELKKQISELISLGVIREPIKKSLDDTQFIKEIITDLIDGITSGRYKA